MVGKEFVYNIDYIKKVKKDGNANMLAVITEITRQAEEAGATSVRINCNDIINKEVRAFFRKAKRMGATRTRGFKVEGSTVWGGDVILTKDL
jgi:hypothetical protein